MYLYSKFVLFSYYMSYGKCFYECSRYGTVQNKHYYCYYIIIIMCASCLLNNNGRRLILLECTIVINYIVRLAAILNRWTRNMRNRDTNTWKQPQNYPPGNSLLGEMKQHIGCDHVQQTVKCKLHQYAWLKLHPVMRLKGLKQYMLLNYYCQRYIMHQQQNGKSDIIDFLC